MINDFAFLVQSQLPQEAELFLKYATLSGLSIEVFPSNDSFLAHFSEHHAVSPNETVKYENYSSWADRAHVVFYVYAGRKRPGVASLDNEMQPRFIAGFRVKEVGFSAKRVNNALRNALGPELNREGLIRTKYSFFRERFRCILEESFYKSNVLPTLEPDEPDWKQIDSENIEAVKNIWNNNNSLGARLKTFFDHCPFCLKSPIQVTTWHMSSKPSNVSLRRCVMVLSGWVVRCPACAEEVQHFIPRPNECPDSIQSF